VPFYGAEKLFPRAFAQDGDVFLEVLTDTEGTAGAGEDHAAYGAVGGNRGDRVKERHFRREVQTVHRVGAVQGDRGDAVCGFNQHGRVAHGATVCPTQARGRR
jgi:hypothetical protein